MFKKNKKNRWDSRMIFMLKFENLYFLRWHNSVLGLTIVDSMLDPKKSQLLFFRP